LSVASWETEEDTLKKYLMIGTLAFAASAVAAPALAA